MDAKQASRAAGQPGNASFYGSFGPPIQPCGVVDGLSALAG
jgi:hypothetical protein